VSAPVATIARSAWSVFQAELLRLLRGRAAGRACIACIVVLSLVVLLVWPSSATSPDVRAALSATVFQRMLVTQLLAVAVLAPLLVSGTLAGEREAGTWDLLRTTPMPAAWLAVSKALAAGGLITLLLLIMLPLWGAGLVLGAVEPGQFAGALLLLLGLAIVLAGGGVWASAHMPSVLGASLTSLVIAVPAVLVAMFLSTIVVAGGNTAVPAGIFALLAGMGLGSLGVAAAAYSMQLNRRRAPRPKSKAGDAVRPPWEVHLRRDRFPDKLLLRPIQDGRWPDGTNPYYLREASAGVQGMGAVAVQVTLLGGCAAIMVLTVVSMLWSGGGLAMGLGLAGALAAAVSAAQALPAEADRGTLALLRTIPGAVERLPRGQMAAAARLGIGMTLALGFVALPGFGVHVLRIAGIEGVGEAALSRVTACLATEAALILACVALGVGVGTFAAGTVRTAVGSLIGALLGLALLILLPGVFADVWRAVTGLAPDTPLWVEWWSLLTAIEPAERWNDLARWGYKKGSGPNPLAVLRTAACLASTGVVLALLGAAAARRRLRAG
jgi:ABC-type transport system involved in multi-copper enzyme maturation permease subunit